MEPITTEILYAALKLEKNRKRLIKLHDRIPSADLEDLLRKNPTEIRDLNGSYQGCRGEILPDETIEKRKLFLDTLANIIETYQEKGVTKKLRRKMLKELIMGGLLTDGAHHKQWYLEQIAELMDIKLNKDLYEAGLP